MTQDSQDRGLPEQIDDLLGRGFREFVLEIHGVPYIDSNGLGQLIQAYRSIKAEGGHLRIVGVTGRIHELVSLATPGEGSDTNAPDVVPEPADPRLERPDRKLAIWFALSVVLVILLILIARLAGFNGV